jgi:hypothetical protein
MSKERGLTDYIGDWGKVGDKDGGDYDGGVPYRDNMPPSPEYGYTEDKIGTGGYGHSDDCKDVGQKGASWGAKQSDIERGYEPAERYDAGQFEQQIPEKNEWDRTVPYSDERGRSNTGAYTGVGNDKRNPGTQQIGSSSVKPGNQAD